jgi:cytochrome b
MIRLLSRTVRHSTHSTVAAATLTSWRGLASARGGGGLKRRDSSYVGYFIVFLVAMQVMYGTKAGWKRVIGE